MTKDISSRIAWLTSPVPAWILYFYMIICLVLLVGAYSAVSARDNGVLLPKINESGYSHGTVRGYECVIYGKNVYCCPKYESMDMIDVDAGVKKSVKFDCYKVFNVSKV